MPPSNIATIASTPHGRDLSAMAWVGDLRPCCACCGCMKSVYFKCPEAMGGTEFCRICCCEMTAVCCKCGSCEGDPSIRDRCCIWYESGCYCNEFDIKHCCFAQCQICCVDVRSNVCACCHRNENLPCMITCCFITCYPSCGFTKVRVVLPTYSFPYD
jgi:hypothetical protein